MMDEPPNENELREAEALAEVLEKGVEPPSEQAPADALEVAAMLRYRRDGELAHKRGEEVLEELLRGRAGGDELAQRRARRRVSRLLVPGLASFAAAAAVVLVFFRFDAGGSRMAAPMFDRVAMQQEPAAAPSASEASEASAVSDLMAAEVADPPVAFTETPTPALPPLFESRRNALDALLTAQHAALTARDTDQAAAGQRLEGLQVAMATYRRGYLRDLAGAHRGVP